MLSPAKHLYHAARISNPSGAAKMLRGAQHDVLFELTKVLKIGP